MPKLLTERATILCPHGGQGTSIPSAPYLTVQGASVLVEGDTGTIAGCPFIQVPCVSYTLRSMGLNATTIMGKKAILATDVQQTNTGLPLIIVETLFAEDASTPAPLPPGASSGDIPPELEDTSEPTVLALPPALAFNSVTMLPPTVVATFTAYHAHPLSWELRLLNTVAKTDVDLTSGLPGRHGGAPGRRLEQRGADGHADPHRALHGGAGDHPRLPAQLLLHRHHAARDLRLGRGATGGDVSAEVRKCGSGEVRKCVGRSKNRG